MEAANLLLYLLVLHSITYFAFELSKPIPLCTVLQLAQRILHTYCAVLFPSSLNLADKVQGTLHDT